ncbi:hypothetical protein EMIT0232MI5_20244 [Pseudomonas sp. IT-232MI5]
MINSAAGMVFILGCCRCRTDGRNNKAPSIAGGALGLLRWGYLRQKHHDPPVAVVVVRVSCSARMFMGRSCWR